MNVLFKPMILMAALLFACGTDVPDEASHEDEHFDEASAWEEAFRESSSGKSDNPGCSGVTVPDRPGFGGRVALTFDDGPNPVSTNKVLDILKARDIKATFFINGNRVKGQADHDALKRIVAEGHILANHSQGHKNLKTLGIAEVEREVDATHQIIKNANVEPMYFRFPFGSSNCQTADLVKTFGYRITGWHIDSADWCFASSRGGVGYCDPSTFQHVPNAVRNDMVEFIMQQVRKNNGGILLQHDIHMNTANHLDEVISRLDTEGYTFVNIDDVSTFPLLNSEDLNDFTFVGTDCTDSATCDFSEKASCLVYDNAGADAGFCTVECQGFCEDFPGHAPTFCVSLDGTNGVCVSKSSTQNQNCEGMPGTTPTLKDRFIGTSAARAATATVCLPEGI